MKTVALWFKYWVVWLVRSGGGSLEFLASISAAAGSYQILIIAGESTWGACLFSLASIIAATKLKRTVSRQLAIMLFWGLRGSIALGAAIAHIPATSGTSAQSAWKVAALFFVVSIFLEFCTNLSRTVVNIRFAILPGESVRVPLGPGPYCWLQICYSLQYSGGSTIDLRAKLMRKHTALQRNLLFDVGEKHKSRILVNSLEDLVFVFENITTEIAVIAIEVIAE